MSKLNKTLKNITLLLGLISVGFFLFDYVFFLNLQPKTVHFQTVTEFEEKLMNLVGVGLLLFLIFCFLSLFQIAKRVKNAKKITLSSILLITIGVLSSLFVFSDVALINDIGKQYKHGLSQPEWSILYPIISFQLFTALIFIYSHFLESKKKDQVKHVARDHNIFLVVQYIGVICGLLGLSSTSLGFLFPRAWNLEIHTVAGSIILLIPYALAVTFWLITKFQEKNREWYDEKQREDVGKSAFLTLVLSVVFMTTLFVANFHNLGGIVSVLWLSLYLFFVLFFFSLGNLYYNGKN